MRLHEQVKALKKTIRDLENQLEASEQRADMLADLAAETKVAHDEMRDQIKSFQKLVKHTAAVTTWRVQ